PPADDEPVAVDLHDLVLELLRRRMRRAAVVAGGLVPAAVVLAVPDQAAGERGGGVPDEGRGPRRAGGGPAGGVPPGAARGGGAWVVGEVYAVRGTACSHAASPGAAQASRPSAIVARATPPSRPVRGPRAPRRR